MKLNRVETLLMNNPVRATIQRHYEAAVLERLGGRMDGGRALEIGCGRGVGTEIILKRFGASRVDAFDLDEKMVSVARRRLKGFDSKRVRLWVGDATKIEAPDADYDAIFDFGVIHHVPEWREAVREIARVLKPNGRFYFEEVTKHALDRWSYRTVLEHPSEDRFSVEEFVAALEVASIDVGDNFVTRFFGDFVLGVGRRVSREPRR